MSAHPDRYLRTCRFVAVELAIAALLLALATLHAMPFELSAVLCIGAPLLLLRLNRSAVAFVASGLLSLFLLSCVTWARSWLGASAGWALDWRTWGLTLFSDNAIVEIWSKVPAPWITSSIAWPRWWDWNKAPFPLNVVKGGTTYTTDSTGAYYALRLFWIPTENAMILLSCMWLWFAVALVGQCRARFRTLRAEADLCVRCGYDLTGNVSGACPECGTRCGRGEAGGR